MLLEMRSVSKSFENEQVLHNIIMDIASGEAHALIGPNGSGKSTIAKILSGAERHDSGMILFQGVPINNKSPADARNQGIYMMYQEHFLIASMTVLDNIFIGNYKKKFGIFVDKKRIRREAQKALSEFDCNISLDQRVSELTIGEQYLVSVARAFVQNAKMFIFDEPTAGLSAKDRNVVYRLINCLKKHGVGVLYITHRIDELRKICDSVSIMRDGRIVMASKMKDITDALLLEKMEVCDNNIRYTTTEGISGEAVLSLRHLSKKNAYKDVNLDVMGGEVLGILGARGAGRTALLKTVFGAIYQDSGDILVKGEKLEHHSIHKAITKYKIGYLADERLQYGIIPNMNAIENTVFPQRTVKGSFFIHSREETEWFIKLLAEEGYFLPDPMKPIHYVSGGNQQKSLFFRWIITNSEIILLDEPTKGIDIGSKNEMYCMIHECARTGTAFIFCSSDIEELRPICTRILSIKNGELKELN